MVRDADLLAKLGARAEVYVYLSIPFADRKSASLVEPQAPARRFEAIRRLHDAGVPVGVFIAPVIPGLTDCEIPAILEQAARAGADSAAMSALRLPGSVEQVFLRKLGEAMPLRAQRVISCLRDIRGGRLDDAAFGVRMWGRGAYWESIVSLFEISKRRYGLDRKDSAGAVPSKAYQPAQPSRRGQLAFDFESPCAL